MSDVRFYPVNKDSSYYEHFHRYLFARAFVRNKRILDISSGEGYGSDILHEVCQQVIGCDIDESAVRDANKKYGCGNLRFVQGDCRKMPFENNCFDAVVSFETIEHIDEHEAFLDEVARVLKKRGLFIVSTPDKRLYTDERGYHNRDHVHELYKEEFIALLKQRFKYVHVYGERLIRSCFIGRLDDLQEAGIGASVNRERLVNHRKLYVPASEDTRIDPMYIILVCGNYRIPRQETEHSYFFDNDADDEIAFAKRGIDNLEEQVQKAHGAIGDLEEQLQKAHEAINNLEGQIRGARQTIQNKDQEILCAKEGIEDLKIQLENAKVTIDVLQRKNEDLTMEAEKMNKEIIIEPTAESEELSMEAAAENGEVVTESSVNIAVNNEEDNNESDLQYREPSK